MLQTLSIKNLRDVKEILDSSGVRYWLDGGTLLGAIRDGKLLSWMEDIDIGTLSLDLDKIVLLFPEFKKRGFSVSSSKYSVKFMRYKIPIDLSINCIQGEYMGIVWIKPISFTSKILKTMSKALAYKVYIRPKKKSITTSINHLVRSRESLETNVGLIQDIMAYFSSFLPHHVHEGFFHAVSSLTERSNVEFYPVLVPKHYYEKLGCIEFYGMKLNIPSDVDRYLELRYGKDWKTPRRDWDPYRDEGALARKWLG